MQDAPTAEERMFRDKAAVTKDTPIKGVRMGAGERSYLVRDNQIDVLKNMYGGVQVSTIFTHAALEAPGATSKMLNLYRCHMSAWKVPLQWSLRTELVMASQPAFQQISQMGCRCQA